MSVKTKKLRQAAAPAIIAVVLVVLLVREYESRQDLVFAEALDKTAVVVDGYALTLRDMAFYIAYQENKIEASAHIYNAQNTDEYWNIYTNHMFLRAEGKQAVMDMAVHDEIFYRLSEAQGLVLSEAEQEHLANDCYDFWNDLEAEQRERLGVGEEVIAESMRRAALAEKYQSLLAEAEQKGFEEYSYTGEEYEKLQQEHSFEIKSSVWDRVHFGGVTVDH